RAAGEDAVETIELLCAQTAILDRGRRAPGGGQTGWDADAGVRSELIEHSTQFTLDARAVIDEALVQKRQPRGGVERSGGSVRPRRRDRSAAFRRAHSREDLVTRRAHGSTTRGTSPSVPVAG